MPAICFKFVHKRNSMVYLPLTEVILTSGHQRLRDIIIFIITMEILRLPRQIPPILSWAMEPTWDLIIAVITRLFPARKIQPMPL